jgi:hypothetical protein
VREMFVVRYSVDTQPGLPRHRDASFLSFVVQLNSPTEFEGGGTRFCTTGAPAAPPIVLCQGDALGFVGRRLHAAAPVTCGARFVLAGFVDLRCPLPVLLPLAKGLRSLDPSCAVSSSRSLPRPHLRLNILLLRRLARGKSGEELLRYIASRRLRLEGADLGPLEQACREHFRRSGSEGGGRARETGELVRRRGMCLCRQPHSRFVARVLRDERDGGRLDTCEAGGGCRLPGGGSGGEHTREWRAEGMCTRKKGRAEALLELSCKGKEKPAHVRDA